MVEEPGTELYAYFVSEDATTVDVGWYSEVHDERKDNMPIGKDAAEVHLVWDSNLDQPLTQTLPRELHARKVPGDYGLEGADASWWRVVDSTLAEQCFLKTRLSTFVRRESELVQWKMRQLLLFCQRARDSLLTSVDGKVRQMVPRHV